MSKQTAILDAKQFRYVISPLRPGNVCTVQHALKAIKDSTSLSWKEIADYFGLKNANRAFRVAYLNKKITEDMLYLKQYLVIDASQNCAYIYDKDHKPAQVETPHAGPTVVAQDVPVTVIEGIPTLFATRVVIADELNRNLMMTCTPTGGYITFGSDTLIYEVGTPCVVTGSVKSLNKYLSTAKFIGKGNGSAGVTIKVDDLEQQTNSVASTMVKISVAAAEKPSIPVITAPETLAAKIDEFVPLDVSVVDDDDKVLAVRITTFNCELSGFKNFLGVLEAGKFRITTGQPEFINADLEHLQVRLLNHETASIGIELRSKQHYELKYIIFTTEEDVSVLNSEPETVILTTKPEKYEGANAAEVASGLVFGGTKKDAVTVTLTSNKCKLKDGAAAAQTNLTKTDTITNINAWLTNVKVVVGTEAGNVKVVCAKDNIDVTIPVQVTIPPAESEESSGDSTEEIKPSTEEVTQPQAAKSTSATTTNKKDRKANVTQPSDKINTDKK